MKTKHWLVKDYKEDDEKGKNLRLVLIDLYTEIFYLISYILVYSPVTYDRNSNNDNALNPF